MVSNTDMRNGNRLTLHIGIHRTGTTGLQRTLATNRPRLAAQGKCYPFKGANHQTIAWEIHKGELDGAGLIERLEAHAGEGHVILSGEDFCIHRDLGWVGALDKVYDVDAVVYLRRQDHWVMSWYNQHIKWPFSRRHSVMTPQEFLGCLDEFHWLDFEALLARWEAVLGHDNVTVRVLEKEQVTDTIADFLALAGIDRAKLRINDRQQNDSLPVEMLGYARALGMFDIAKPRRGAIVRFLQAAAKSAGCGARTLYTAAERETILERFAISNTAVARHWFGRETLFMEKAPDDDGLHADGAFAARGNYDDLMRLALRALAEDQD